MSPLDNLIKETEIDLAREPDRCPCRYCMKLRTRLKALLEARDTLTILEELREKEGL